MLTELIVIIDKSGSMSNKVSDVIGGFNQFLHDQKAMPEPAALTLVLFDTGMQVVHDRLLVGMVPELTDKTYVPGGSTALLDAIGKTMRNIEMVGSNAERSIMVVITDGEENSSQEFTLAGVREMIKAKEDTGKWETIYLGANVDSFAEAGALGTKMGNAANWNPATKDGLKKAFASASLATSQYRGGMTYDAHTSTAWRPDDADQSEDKP